MGIEPWRTRAVSAAEAKNGLDTLLGYVVEQHDEVIVERHGRPEAVQVSVDAYDELQSLRERERRETEARLARLRRLSERIGDRNRDLTDEEVEELADRFAHEMIDDMAAEGKLMFERDAR